MAGYRNDNDSKKVESGSLLRRDPSGRDASGRAKVPGDRDEAKALPDDVAVNERGGPDADVHHPAAASTTADEEAGADTSSSSGRIEPLQSKTPRAGPGRR